MKQIKTALLMLSVLVMLTTLIPLASASICTVSGHIRYSDSSPVPDSTKVTIKNLNTLIAYPDATGGEWPFQNYYSISFSCSTGVDDAVISIGSYEKQVSLDDTETVVDITLPWNTVTEPPSTSPSTSTGSYGGGGGGSSSPANDDQEPIVIETIREVPGQTVIQKEIYKEYISEDFEGELYIIDIIHGQEIGLSRDDIVLFYLGDISEGINSYITKLESSDVSSANISIRRYGGNTELFTLQRGVPESIKIDDNSIDVIFERSESEENKDRNILLYLKLSQEPIEENAKRFEPTTDMNWIWFIILLMIILIIISRAYPIEKLIYGKKEFERTRKRAEKKEKE